MKYRKWDPETKAKIVLEGLQNNQPLSAVRTEHVSSLAAVKAW